MRTADTLDRILADVEAYEPTPQEVRWAQIEHHARELARLLNAGEQTRAALAELERALAPMPVKS